ncbi:MAG: glucose-6-phosphate isomerase [Candidatus Margulisbacteria bacterium]|nr:glucose-6-phosphate isomerase [Candidatus Margulisiibacteriota bacterium]MBU1021665.1 glucose-6-phosphate isomerase [Candidatus Margulisiibacteriota bacterium]MBU1728815.1 glucose-6-phosphate isomerase [Candidatus Margulisiibacteriota bacterium]MBU1955781.1 glucose-6-phosphate isomerase [Candidatus Margulisiibacteriota bacterium]
MLKFDYNNLMSEKVGDQGIKSIPEITSDIKAALATINKMQRDEALRVKTGTQWMALPDQEKKLIDDIVATGNDFAKRFKTVISLGIGGSYLGNRMLQDSLKSPYYNDFDSVRDGRPKVYFSGNNVDPESLKLLLDNLDPKTTGVVVISKSGTTTETKAAFENVKEWLRKAGVKDLKNRIIAVTDKAKGTLREEANQNGYKSFIVPDGVGGRFSVLCPVGLVTAAIAGINIKELLRGAGDMNKASQSTDLIKNAPLLYAVLHTILYKEKNKAISILMPFNDSLKMFADWYVQLLAESLGKKLSKDGKVVNVGRTPIPSVGTTDLHSTQQNNVEGEYNKVITFLKVEKPRRDISVPKASADFLVDKPLSLLINTAEEGTEWALVNEKRPSCTIVVPEVNEYYIGQLIYFFEMATAYEGELLNVNTYDQPGVESYKKYMFAMLGKPGFEGKASKLVKDKKYII